ncbi:hypothetical protein Poli38472_006939 [Pythium oligandrum]|uniref:Trimethylguanosine synthase n=1 Tax=Pythium oligandrum TaxID=41045 RepID=A0A8K1C8S9_PYTOL|nr:hypothetical protein Poli38472_006939 [Pythium oligandrum]|eukprot:TMW58794.1 hypothetical protein Poli38472_006939 [Pythium oligandrum]
MQETKDATGGRPATITRSAVVQARSQQQTLRPTSIQTALGDENGTGGGDGWVSVDHHRRRHRPSGDGRREVTGVALNRSQSMVETTYASPRGGATSHSRADALSAAATMDKTMRERSYAAGTTPSSPAAMLPPATTQWGSPSEERTLSRSQSASPDMVAATLHRESSLQKLMQAWQRVENSVKEPNRPRNGSRQANRARDRVESHHQQQQVNGEMPTSTALRRTQSDIPEGNRVRSPTGNGRTNAKSMDGYRGANASASTGNGGSNGKEGTTTQQRKCGDKRDFFFRNLDFETRNMLQIDDVAAFSVTDFEMAKKISMAILELFPTASTKPDFPNGNSPRKENGEGNVPPDKYPLVITDATACVGGNVLSFCDFFQHVNAVECDSTRISMLQNNLHVLNKSGVTCYMASYLDVMLHLSQDVVFIDPPWGGPEYKDLEFVDLYLDTQPLYRVCEKLRGHAQCVVLKVPTNFDDEKFARHVSGHVQVRKDFKKMHLVILDFRSSGTRVMS